MARTVRQLSLALLTTLVVSACGDSKASTSTPSNTAPSTSIASTVSSASVAPSTARKATWEAVTAPANCKCSDGSGFRYFLRRADPTKVLFFLQGGGACFSKETCASANFYTKRVGDGSLPTEGNGIFEFSNPKNPFADYSVVFVPYCTGDVHLGDSTHDYGDGVVVQHKGYVNGTTALAKLAEQFPTAKNLVVAGDSAGSIASPLYAGLAHDLLPSARITVLADGSGAYPPLPELASLVGSTWGSVIPPWPENAGLTLAKWTFAALFVQAAKHVPGITLGRHDYAFDQTQSFFLASVGLPGGDLTSAIDANETVIEASGTKLWTYLSPGSSHVVLNEARFYSETLNGVLFVDWVSALVDGAAVTDQRCSKCTAS